jgi:hypothetical protein
LPRLLTAAMEAISTNEELTMKIMQAMAALLLLSSLATPMVAQQRTTSNGAKAGTQRLEAREVAAPPWSAACMTDHGPSECGEPMWVYGGSDAHALR